MADRKLPYLGLLLIVSLLFFFTARDNPFWNPSDLVYIDRTIDARMSPSQIFVITPEHRFQPLVDLFFLAAYSAFGINAWMYYLFNVFVHSLAAFLVLLLVDTLLKDRAIAVLSSVLFACVVGNYGKAVMVVSGINDLLITLLSLLALLFFFKNELENDGRLLSKRFFAAAVCFVLSLMTGTTSFGIFGCMIVFAVFFRAERRQRVWSPSLVLLGVIAVAAAVAKWIVETNAGVEYNFVEGVLPFFKNYSAYLTRMVLPIHTSSLVAQAGPLIQSIYKFAGVIRLLAALTILSFCVFGFVFGNRTLRFFIAWTFITITPFCFLAFPKYGDDWLDIRHLYLVSVGFSMILASVTVLAARLLSTHRWKRLLPYSFPLLFVILSQFIVLQLDSKYEAIAELPEIRRMTEDLRARHEGASKRGSPSNDTRSDSEP